MTREDAIYEIRQLAVLSTNKNIERITEALNMAIEALTMQYGEWVNSVGKPIKDNHSVYCSICGEWSEYRSDFCPNCGAEMTDRKTEPQRTCDNCGTPRDKCVYCIEEDKMWTPKTEPQTDCSWK